MTKLIRDLAEQAGWMMGTEVDGFTVRLEKFAELLKQAIYDEVREELVDDADIDAVQAIEDRYYLRGNNGGIVDALVIIKKFGRDHDER